MPAWCEASVLEPTIRGLTSLDYSGGFEIVLVAGGMDGTLEKARELQALTPRMRVVEQLRGSKNAALLAGYRQMDPATELVGIVDADTRVSPNWLTDMANCLLAANHSAVQAIYIPANPSWVASYYIFSQYRYLAANKPTFVGRSSLLIRREAIEEVGPARAFDPSITIGADYRLRLLLQLIGHSVGYCERTTVRTWLPASLGTFVRLESVWMRGWSRQNLPGVRFAAHYGRDGLRIASILIAALSAALGRPTVAAIAATPVAGYLVWVDFESVRLAVKRGDRQLVLAAPQVMLLTLIHLFVRFFAMSRVLIRREAGEPLQQGERPRLTGSPARHN